jgi:hypothetical protein
VRCWQLPRRDDGSARHGAGDLSVVVQRVWAARVAERALAGPSVREVNQKLTALTSRDKKRTLSELLGRCSPLEVKWLVRLLRRDLLIGTRTTNPVVCKV